MKMFKANTISPMILSRKYCLFSMLFGVIGSDHDNIYNDGGNWSFVGQ